MQFLRQHIVVVLLLCLSAAARCAQHGVERKVSESLKKMFGDSATITEKQIRLTAEEKAKLAARSKQPWASDTISVYTCAIGRQVVGYGIIDNVKGKAQFITYIVGILPRDEVQDVDVLAYREPYGGEIAYESFRKEFRRKTVHGRLQPGMDIKNISGATISVHAITDGVKKILATFGLIRDRL